MLGENLAALFWLYARPVAAIGRILDRGRLWIALVVALGVSMLVHLPQMVDPGLQAQPDRQIEQPDRLVLPKGPTTGQVIGGAALRWAALDPFSYLSPVGALVLAFVPAILFARAVSGFGSFGVLMRGDYLSLLMCVLMTWAAAYLPLAIVTWLAGVYPVLFLAANLYFLVLAALGVRTVLGTNMGIGLGMAALGAVCAIAGLIVFDIAGPMRYYLMSPFLLYYAYSFLQSDVRSLGEGLRSRQQLRRQLELATNNPRDADAHFQLGLIYQKRHQYTEALARFERAVEIDPTEAEPHYQLGRIAREQKRFDDAVRHLTTASTLDPKLALGDVWRELGAALLESSRPQEAAVALQKFVNRRPYDPEGLYWYGKALAQLGRTAEAREMFQQSIEAVKTSPPHRRSQVRTWASHSKSEMGKLVP